MEKFPGTRERLDLAAEHGRHRPADSRGGRRIVREAFRAKHFPDHRVRSARGLRPIGRERVADLGDEHLRGVVLDPEDCAHGLHAPAVREADVLRAHERGQGPPVLAPPVDPLALQHPETDDRAHRIRGQVQRDGGTTLHHDERVHDSLSDPELAVEALEVGHSAEGTARIIEVLTPGGTERWFEETPELEPGDRKAFDDASRRYGITFLPDSPWTPKIRERFGL